MRPSVYVETTIPSYLTARPSPHPLRAGHQQATRAWWAGRAAFDLYIGRLVVEVCQDGDASAAADRLAALAGIPMLADVPAADGLAAALIRDVPLPAKAAGDAVHIAVAAVYGMAYLLTWNCRHLANATLRPQVEAVCRAAGYLPPIICTPEELATAPPTGGPTDG
jgi:hypothetical protein